jgi:hypothetical protein
LFFKVTNLSIDRFGVAPSGLDRIPLLHSKAGQRQTCWLIDVVELPELETFTKPALCAEGLNHLNT